MMKTLLLLRFLIRNPGWHYGLDLVDAGLCSRFTIYSRLYTLERIGLIERGEDIPRMAGVARARYRFISQ